MSAQQDRSKALLDILAAAQYQGAAKAKHAAHYKRVIRALVTLDVDAACHKTVLEHYACYHMDGKPTLWLLDIMSAARKARGEQERP